MPAIANKLSEAEVTAEPASNAASVKPVVSAAFTPPAESTMPDANYGKVIRLGQKVFKETSTYASRYVGNNLSCANCHLDAGRKANSAPLWASFIHYPCCRRPKTEPLIEVVPTQN